MASLDADAMLEASLDRLKRTNSAYLNDQNPRTAQHFVAAMDGQSKALTSARMFKQAEQMNKAKVDFQNSGPSMRMKIAYSLAKSLVSHIEHNLIETYNDGCDGRGSSVLSSYTRSTPYVCIWQSMYIWFTIVTGIPH